MQSNGAAISAAVMTPRRRGRPCTTFRRPSMSVILYSKNGNQIFFVVGDLEGNEKLTKIKNKFVGSDFDN
jgi:hypothetical protein